MSDAPSDSSGGDPRQEAEQLYVEFLGSDEASLTYGFERLAQRHPKLEEELRSLHAEFENLERVLDEAAASPEFPFEELSRLHARGGHRRYRIEGEIARGGQGAVMRIWDSDLKRHLAMKLTLGRVTSSSAGDGHSPTPASSTPPLDSRTIHRFLNEAKITGQLDHPGIVPIHELGVDDDGQAYFTMKLVNGHSLHEIFHRHRQGDPEWTTQRCVGLILKATEAVAYAHSKGIIHRDLKPANIMVGEYGEVYVMDWGMARDLATSAIGEPSNDDELEVASGLTTQEGAVMGTPAYMPPEQARGEISRLGPRSDVYSLGAVLYELLVGSPPFKDLHRDVGRLEILEQIQNSVPDPISVSEEDPSGELAAVSGKAMSKEPENRYGTAEAMLADLRAYTEGRVVTAHATGVMVEAKKWVKRNPLLAASMAAGALILLLGVLGVAWSENKRARESARARWLSGLEADYKRCKELMAELETPRGVGAESTSSWISWVADYERILARLPELQDSSGQGVTVVPPSSIDSTAFDVLKRRVDDLASYLGRVDAFLESNVDDTNIQECLGFKRAAQRLELATGRWQLASQGSQMVSPRIPASHRETVAGILHCLEFLQDPWVQAVDFARGSLEASRDLRRISIDQNSSAWNLAIGSIGDRELCPAYNGLQVQAIEGLVPLGMNPDTGLWEFWHVASGERPQPDADGRYVQQPETGLIFVLVPGGDVVLGAQRRDASLPRYDPNASNQDDPPVAVGRLAPFLISKYELTQAQWWRLDRSQPSTYNSGLSSSPYPRISPIHPVETVSFRDCVEALSRWRLTLPTEAQWEWAALGGGGARFGAAADPVSAALSENCAKRNLPFVAPPVLARTVDLRAYRYHAPVGSLTPNAFGLYDCLGNVSEWCLDVFTTSLEKVPAESIAPGSLEIIGGANTAGSYRGGHYLSSAPWLRAYGRYRASRFESSDTRGVRPALALL